jgi:hypothetical protein
MQYESCNSVLAASTRRLFPPRYSRPPEAMLGAVGPPGK